MWACRYEPLCLVQVVDENAACQAVDTTAAPNGTAPARIELLIQSPSLNFNMVRSDMGMSCIVASG